MHTAGACILTIAFRVFDVSADFTVRLPFVRVQESSFVHRLPQRRLEAAH